MSISLGFNPGDGTLTPAAKVRRHEDRLVMALPLVSYDDINIPKQVNNSD